MSTITYSNGVEFNIEVAQTIAAGYIAALGRVPAPSSQSAYNDAGGLLYWTNQYLGGADASSGLIGNYGAIGDQMIGSAEFEAAFGTDLTDNQFVNLLYTNLLGRDADAGGLEYWTGLLTGGTSRGQVLMSFSNTAENVTHIESQLATTESYGLALATADTSLAPDFTDLTTLSSVADPWLAANPDLDPAGTDTTAPVVDASQSFSYGDNVTDTTTHIAEVTATDNVGVTSYSIASGNDSGYFAIDDSGNITLTTAGIAAGAGSLTAGTSFTLGVQASDAAGNTSASVDVGLSVTDATAPTLAATNPVVISGTNLSLNFTENLASKLPAATDFQVLDGTSTAVSVNSVTINGSTVTLALASTPSGTVTVAYTPNSDTTKDLQDASGNTVAAISSQTAVTDTTAPTLSSSSPTDGATDVAVASDLTLTFSETVKAGTGNIVITNATDSTDTRTISVTDTTQVSFSGTTVTVNPTSDLKAGAHYVVTLNSGVISDAAGNAFAGISNYDLDFTTPGGTTSTGQTFTLTSGIDVLPGLIGSGGTTDTSGDDIIIGDNNVASAGDQLNGGTGTDTLKLFTPAATNVPTMSSIEQLYISGATANLILSGNTGLTGLTINADTAGRTYTLATTAPVSTVTVSNNPTGAVSTVVAGLSATTLALNLDAAGDNTTGATVLQTIDLQGTSLTTVNVSSSNSSSATVGNDVLLKDTTGLITTVNVAGDKALMLDLSSETSITSLVSTMTAGGVTANVQGLTLTKATGASGNDAFLFGTTAVGSTAIDGGSGTDIVGTNAANTLGLFASNAIVNAETVKVQDAFVVNTGTAGYGNAFNLAKVAGATNVSFGAALTTDDSAAAKTLTISNMASGGTVTFGAGFTETTAAAGLVVNIKDAGLSTSDVLNVALTQSGATTINGFTSQGVETLNIDSKNANTTDFGGLVDAQLASIKLTSSLTNNGTAGTFTLDGTGTAFSSTIINSVDASGYNGAVTMTALANNLVASGATINGGTGVLTATGSAGADTVTGGKGGIAYTLAGGADSINISASTATADTIVVGAGNSGPTAFAHVTGFVADASNADTIDTATAVTAANVTTATATGITNVSYTMSSGFITFSGSALASTSVSSLIDAILSATIDNATGDTYAFESGGNTYVIDADGTAGTGANDIVIELVGTTGVTALSTTAAAHTILIA
jgi:methionine-rich copper-binding protein CopC